MTVVKASVNTQHAKPVSWKAILAGLFLVITIRAVLSPLAVTAQSSPSVTATNYFRTTNYVVVAVVTSSCPPCVTNPPGPINLTATAPNPTNIWLRWRNQSTNQLNVQIYQRTGGTSAWWLVADVSGNVSNVMLSTQPNTFCEFYALGVFADSLASLTTSNLPPTNTTNRLAESQQPNPN